MARDKYEKDRLAHKGPGIPCKGCVAFISLSLFLWPCDMWDLSSPPGRSFNHWTTKKVPSLYLFGGSMEETVVVRFIKLSSPAHSSSSSCVFSLTATCPSGKSGYFSYPFFCCHVPACCSITLSSALQLCQAVPLPSALLPSTVL